MGIIVLDIEVLKQDPEPFMVKDQSEIRAPANYKDPDKIAAYIEQAAASQVDDLRNKSSLEPLLGGTVFAVGIAVNTDAPKALLAPTGDEAGEREVLAKLQAGLKAHEGKLLVTWNGARYDLEFLRKRALRHGLYELARRCYFDKPWARGHIDLFPVWQGNNREAVGKLHQVCSFLGIESDDKVAGGQISDLYLAGMVDAVRDHVLEDVRLTRELFYRFRSAGWVVTEGPDSPVELPVRPPRGGAA